MANAIWAAYKPETWTSTPHFSFVLGLCDHSQELALNSIGFLSFFLFATKNDFFRLPQTADAITHRNLQFTMVDSEDCYSDSLPLVIASKITRIRNASYESLRRYPSLHLFTHLSHFSVPYYDLSRHDPEKMLRILRREGFSVLVIEMMETMDEGDKIVLEKWVRSVQETDKRICVMHSVPYSSGFLAQWEKEKRSGESFWERAMQHTIEWESSTSQG